MQYWTRYLTNVVNYPPTQYITTDNALIFQQLSSNKPKISNGISNGNAAFEFEIVIPHHLENRTPI